MSSKRFLHIFLLLLFPSLLYPQGLVLIPSAENLEVAQIVTLQIIPTISSDIITNAIITDSLISGITSQSLDIYIISNYYEKSTNILIFQNFEISNYIFPSFEVMLVYISNKITITQIIDTPKVAFAVKEIEINPQEGLKGLKDIIHVSFKEIFSNIKIILIILIILLALVVLGIWLYRKHKKKEEKQPELTWETLKMDLEKVLTIKDQTYNFYSSSVYLLKKILHKFLGVHLEAFTINEMKKLISKKLKNVVGEDTINQVNMLLDRANLAIFAKKDIPYEQVLKDGELIKELFYKLWEEERKSQELEGVAKK